MNRIHILKVLIADDEYLIRKWFGHTLRNLPDIKVNVVGTAANGEEALTLFREKRPDVIFTDIKMPVLDGLELLRMVKQESPNTAVVIISSYSEFAYAKEAIVLNAFDYVLKEETNARKLEEILRRIQVNRQKEMVQKDVLALQFEQEIFLNSLIVQRRMDCTGQELEEHRIHLDENGMFAIAFRIDNLLSDRVLETFMSENVENVLYYSYQKNVRIAIGNTTCIGQLAYQNTVIFRFAEKLSKCFESPVGISGPYFQYEQIVTMMLKSIQALNMSFYQKGAERIFYAWNVADFEMLHDSLEEQGTRILEKVKAGEQEDLTERIRELLDDLEEQAPGDVPGVKQFLFRLISNVCQILSRDFLRLPDKMVEFCRKIETCENFGTMRELIFQQLEEQRSAVGSVKYSSYVMRSIEYMEKNYSRIAYITEVAESVGLNEDYLGHLFKSETGVTLNQFLNNTRMNQAIWLLNNTQLKTYEIADKIGYANAGYFSKIFKKRFHISPGEFRNMQEE